MTQIDDDPIDRSLRRIATKLDDISLSRTAGADFASYARPAISRSITPRRRRTRQPALVIAVLIIAAIGVSVVALSNRDTSPPPVQRETTGERLLLLAPGWTVDRYSEQPAYSGGINFETTFSRADGAVLQLHQRADRYNDQFMTTAGTFVVLGSPAVLLESSSSQRLFWRDGSYDFELRTGRVPMQRDEFLSLVDELHRVNEAAWRAALPASMVLPDNRDAAVAEILLGVPVPEGFDTSTLGASLTTNDRYVVGAQILGPIVCAWTRQWLAAEQAGDDAARQRALDALTSSRSWLALIDMTATGMWPQTVWNTAERLAKPPADRSAHEVALDAIEGFRC